MLSDELKQQIQLAYRTFLDKKGLTPRYGQRLMIAEIARGIAGVVQDNDGKRTGDQHVVVIEAGTGTGKTLAYLLGVMPVAKAMGKKDAKLAKRLADVALHYVKAQSDVQAALAAVNAADDPDHVKTLRDILARVQSGEDAPA